MTNFTQEIKRELLNYFPQKECCKRAAFSSLLITSGSLSSRRLQFLSENERVSEYFVALADELGVSLIMNGAEYDPKSGKDIINFFAEGESAARAAELVALSEKERAQRQCCALAFLRGAFLGGGSCQIPRGGAKSGYHLETVFPTADEAESFCILLDGLDLWGRTVKRGEKQVVYLKSREAISDFLSVAGAKNALSELESVSAAREESNLNNRVGNCMAGNADKSMTASAAQIYKIEKLKQSGKFVLLPEELASLAALRLENPTLSLAELGQKAGLSKSCLSHRFRKLMQFCTDAEEKV